MTSFAFILGLLISPADTLSPAQLISESKMVFSATVVEDVRSHYRLNLIEAWKGGPARTTLIKKTDATSHLEMHESYLFFAVPEIRDEISPSSPPIRWDLVPKPLASTLNAQLCFLQSETIEERKKRDPRLTGACVRVLDPVCGCDRVTYGNSCEAWNAGILHYTQGECKKLPAPDGQEDPEQTVAKSPLIFTAVVYGDATPKHYGIKLTEAWKGQPNVYESLEKASIGVDLEEGAEYLFFAQRGPGNDHLRVSFAPVKLKDISAPMRSVLNYMPCVVTPTTGACLRGGLETVCGCDGITYDSPCEASHKGIVHYVAGRCKDK